MGRLGVFCFGVALLSGCGGSDTNGTFKITSMTSPSRRALPRGAVDTDRLAASTTAYSFAVVDGVKYHLTKIRGLDAASDNPLVEIPMVKDIELTGDVNQTVALNESVSWKAGNFRGMSLYFKNSWSVKAYCRTQKTGGSNTGFLVYTRAGQVGALDCSSNDCSVLPDDYDYHDYDFLNTYEGYVSANEYQQETHYNFTVGAGETPIISMLYDGSYNVSCWDGQQAWSNSESMAPFNMSIDDDTERQQYYPNGIPAFSIGYLAVYGYATTDANEAAPNARAFITSNNSSADVDLTSGSFNFKSLPVATLVYKADGTIYAGSTRNYQGTGGHFDLDLEGFTAASGGTGQDFFSSGWYWAGTAAAPIFVRNRKFASFDPPTTPATFTTVVTDGEDCGKTMTDFQGNNPSRACLGTSQNVYWREMTR